MHHLSSIFASLYGETSVLVALYDGQDRLRHANPAFRAAYHLDATETPLWPDLMRRNHRAGRGTVIQAADFEAWLTSTQSRRGKSGFRAFETDLVDGRWLWMTETVQSDGWMLCVANDITSLRAEERTIRQARDLAIRASQTDDLTGVANRRFVMKRMEDMLQAGLDGSGGSVALLDIDHFKQINDRHGHQTGDLVLCDFARRGQRQVRRADTFGRVGGEEFLLVLPNTRIDQAKTIVERMLDGHRGTAPIPELPDLTYTFSAGIAQSRVGDTPSQLYARADQALYAAKSGGRNGIHLDPPPFAKAVAA
ncbi:MAG TPA: GGDEF domain-containing protein [Microvirga sp.]|jgi:diguanylate cyclase (GGDEF)-like protein|nr:GGDEF domain-containing protein [Microvirga sp.]